MTRAFLLYAALGASLPAAPAMARHFDVPQGDEPQEQDVPDFRGVPTRQDLQSLVDHLGRCITEPNNSRAGVASIDEFLSGLEAVLRQGNDVPRDRIIRNADSAREALRLAYNDLAAATDPEFLQAAREDLKAVAEGLPPILAKNRASVAQLGSLASAARATYGAIAIEPPESPGPEVPLALLSTVQPLRPDLVALRDRLKGDLVKVRKAKAFVARAKEQAAFIETLAQRAEALDKDALGRLGERRTMGTTERYETRMLSREVILNANKWLKASVEKGEAVTRAFEDQMDPKKDGIRKALDLSFEADRRTQDGKELETRSANRINFNHTMRLNDVIQRGYEVASDGRKPWWVNRARMARTEAGVDAGKMEYVQRDADQAGRDAETATRAGAQAVARLEEDLGRSLDKAKTLAKRKLDVPEPRNTPGVPIAKRSNVKSKPLKVPHTLDVSDGEIMGSYDSGNP